MEGWSIVLEDGSGWSPLEGHQPDVQAHLAGQAAAALLLCGMKQHSRPVELSGQATESFRGRVRAESHTGWQHLRCPGSSAVAKYLSSSRKSLKKSLLLPACSLLIGITQTSTSVTCIHAQEEMERRRWRGKMPGTSFSWWPLTFCNITSHRGRNHRRHSFRQQRSTLEHAKICPRSLTDR